MTVVVVGELVVAGGELLQALGGDGGDDRRQRGLRWLAARPWGRPTTEGRTLGRATRRVASRGGSGVVVGVVEEEEEEKEEEGGRRRAEGGPPPRPSRAVA